MRRRASMPKASSPRPSKRSARTCAARQLNSDAGRRARASRYLDLRGTFFPSLRASERPMAMACLRLVTFFPLLPLLRVPRLRLRIARSTSLEAPREFVVPWFNSLLIRAGVNTRSAARATASRLETTAKPRYLFHWANEAPGRRRVTPPACHSFRPLMVHMHGLPYSHRSAARRSRPVREPRQGADRYCRRPRDGGRRCRREAVGGNLRRCDPPRGAGAPLRIARRGEARGRARSLPLRSDV